MRNARVIKDSLGFLRLEPVPDADEVERYYRDEFYARTSGAYVNNSSLANMEEEAEHHGRGYEDLWALVESRLPGRVTAADVGCGYGHWLAFLAARGVEGWGVEPVAEGVQHCRSMGIAAYELGVEGLEQPPTGERVSLVSLLNVLEHLRDPVAVLRAIRDQWLEPCGVLLLRVPNDFNQFQLAADELHGLDRWWVLPPRHINYFSHESLSKLVEHCGFELLECTSSFPLDLFLLMGDVYVGDPVLGKACHRKRVEFERALDSTGRRDLRRRLYRLLAETGLGRDVVVVARKP